MKIGTNILDDVENYFDLDAWHTYWMDESDPRGTKALEDFTEPTAQLMTYVFKQMLREIKE